MLIRTLSGRENATANLVQVNLIDTNVSSTLILGRSGNGIGIDGDPTNRTIGGTVIGASNTITFNVANGVLLTANTEAGNTISLNSIFANGGLRIDLGDDGVTGEGKPILDLWW